MPEFAFKSRKNETANPDFKVEKLEKPDEPQSLELLEPKAAGIRLEKRPDTLPRLPWELERLLSAACLDEPLGADVRGVLDPNRYALAWGAAYLVGDRDEALGRLWQVYRAWRGVSS